MIEKLKEMLRRHEGLRLKPYICPAGKKTIGVGWNLEAHKLPDDIASCLRMTGSITELQAERLLNISITQATDDCRAIYPGFDGFTEPRRFALIDFVFNVGAGTALKFKKMLAAMEVRDWDKAADEMYNSAWFSQVGDRGAEIVGMVRTG
jgi:lysozyme